MQNAGLDEAQLGIKVTGRNVNNLRYADDTTLMAESKETKKPLDEGERGEWKSCLKLNIQKLTSWHPAPSLQYRWETMQTVTHFVLLGSKITADGDWSHEIKRCLLPGRKAMTNP